MSEKPYRMQFWALIVVIIIGFAFLVYAGNEGRQRTYSSGEYFVHTSFRNDVYMIANVKNNNDLRSKLIRYEVALENGLISYSASLFRRFDIHGQEIIRFVWGD